MLNLYKEDMYLKSQLGFYDFVLIPLFRLFIKFYPPLNHLYLSLMQNRIGCALYFLAYFIASQWPFLSKKQIMIMAPVSSKPAS